MRKIQFRHFVLVAFTLLTFFVINGCRKEVIVTKTTDDVNITGYLERRPEDFSMLSEVLARTGTQGYLGAYGKYTLFAPNNDAITEWLTSINKTSLNDVDDDSLKEMIKFHLIIDTLGTKNFNDGKIKQPTIYGQYLLTGAINFNGASTYLVNKQARIIEQNIRTANGLIHVLDKVLVPQIKTIAELIEEQKDGRYSIFYQALKVTGFYDSLNVKRTASANNKKFQTLIAESDSALNAAGFTSFDRMKELLSVRTKNDPRNHADSLWLYVAYHVLPDANYTADIITTPALSTLAPFEVITTKTANQKVILNEVEFKGIVEPGVPLIREKSDITADNGVIHEANSSFKIKFRVQEPLYWDVCDMKMIKDNPAYGRATFEVDYNTPTSDIRQESDGKKKPQIDFGGGSPRVYAYNDHLTFSTSTSAAGSRHRWFELRTPMLVKGLYKVWVCYAQNSGSGAFQVTMNAGTPYEQVLSNGADFTKELQSGSGISPTTLNYHTLREQYFYKTFIATRDDYQLDKNGVQDRGPLAFNINNMTGRMAGIANIQTTDRQWIKFTALTGNGDRNTWLDMIHFIPLDRDQLWPRFSSTGTVFYKKP